MGLFTWRVGARQHNRIEALTQADVRVLRSLAHSDGRTFAAVVQLMRFAYGDNFEISLSCVPDRGQVAQ